MSPENLTRQSIRLGMATAIALLLNPAGTVTAPAVHAAGSLDSGLLIYSTEGNRLRRYDVDTIGGELAEDILVERASLDAENGRDSNGVICGIPDGSNRYLLGEDTGQPNVPPGWGIFSSAIDTAIAME